jgi:hypothetical protein
MVSLVKTLRATAGLAAALVLIAAAPGAAAPPEEPPAARMSLIPGKDVSGTVYKKLGLPNVKYCWDTCVREPECSGARWGVIQGDVAGLCLLLRGELTLKSMPAHKTEEGKPIQVTAAKKLPGPGGDGT